MKLYGNDEMDFVNYEINLVRKEYYDSNVMITQIHGAITARSVVASVYTLAHGCYVTTLQGYELVFMALKRGQSGPSLQIKTLSCEFRNKYFHEKFVINTFDETEKVDYKYFVKVKIMINISERTHMTSI